MSSQFISHFNVFVLALAISYVATPIIAKLANRFKILDQPAKNKLHKIPTPRLGGLAIFIGYFLSLLLTNNLDPSSRIIIFGGMAILILGVLDDIFKVPAVIKLIFIFILTVLLARQGIIVNVFGELFYLNLFITLFASPAFSLTLFIPADNL